MMKNLKPLTVAVLVAAALTATTTTSSAAPRGDESPAQLRFGHEDIYYDFQILMWIDGAGWVVFKQVDTRAHAQFEAMVLEYVGYEAKIIRVRESWWLRSISSN